MDERKGVGVGAPRQVGEDAGVGDGWTSIGKIKERSGWSWGVLECEGVWDVVGALRFGSWRNRVVHRVRCVRVCGKGSGGGSVGSQRFRQVELLCMGMESKSVGWDGVGVGVGLLHCVCCVHLFVFIILLVI